MVLGIGHGRPCDQYVKVHLKPSCNSLVDVFHSVGFVSITPLLSLGLGSW